LSIRASIFGAKIGVVCVQQGEPNNLESAQDFWSVAALLRLACACVVAFLMVGQPVQAGITGAWTTGTSSTATANGVTVTATSSAAITPTTATMYPTNYFANPYSGTVTNAAAFSHIVVPGSGTMTVTYTFSKAVSNPILHVQRLGGSSTTTNSSSWQLTGSNLGTTPTITRLAGNFQFQVNAGNTTFFRPAGVASPTGVCATPINTTTDNGGAACGSVRVNGVGITSVTFTVSMIGNVGVGDGIDILWSIPDENIVVKKQSLSATGSFSFTGTNGAPTTSLNTATSNPISSTAVPVTNLTSPITLTETVTTGFAVTGASCVDQAAAAIASTLAGTTLTIASTAYGDNGTITCTFTNQAIPILAVAKSGPSPALVFGTNSTYTLTVTNSGALATSTAQIKDQLPAGLSFVSATGTNWTCANASGLLTCNFAGGSIAAGGGTSTISVVATPLVTAGNTSVTNSASIDPTGGAGAPTPGAGCAPAASCASNVATVGAVINPVVETGTAVAGVASTPIANVITNDTINGSAVTLGGAGNGVISQSGTWPTGIVLNTTTGAITTTIAVAAGSYSLTYQLCDKSTPVNCRTAIDTVTVTSNIVPVLENGTAVAGTASTPIANVISNDTVNGAAATLGAGGNATIAQSGTWPTGIALNTTTGAITITNVVIPGSYPITYQLCDKATTPNCATVIDTITVTASILPSADSGNATSGVASTPVANVAANDNVNGAPATLGAGGNATVVTSGTWPPGITLNTTTGAISMSSAVPSGTYPVTYQLCDKNTPVNCQTQTVTITVATAISIVPVTESGSAVSGIAGTPLANVISNDTVNGAAATLGAGGNATIAQSGTWPTGIALNAASGAITTTIAVQPGTYNVTYQLCDKATTPNCATVIDTITVTASILPGADSGNATSGVASTPVANVAANDNVNGAAATLGAGGNATVATSGTWPAGISLNTATGAISTTSAVPPGVYSIAYQLCDKNTPVNCQAQTVAITIAAAISPVTESGTAISGTAGTPIANVVSNDIVNGAAATLGPGGNATIAQSGTWPTGIALNTTTGAITTTNLIVPGSYSLTYQLCDKATTPNCATVIDTITVTASILPGTDSGTVTAGVASTPVANVAANDSVNGTPATLGAGGNATVAISGTWPAGISLNSTTGAISTTSAVLPGSYSVNYQLCDKNTPVNCQTQAVTITVSASILPLTESGTAVSGTAATPIANVASNDTVNSAPATLGAGGNATIAQSGTWPTGISLNTITGAITTNASVQPGTYNVSYQLCDKNTPVNCQTVIDAISVTGNIVPVTENGSGVSGTTSNVIANVAANDSVNGSAANVTGGAPNAVVAQSGVWPTGITLAPTTGAVSISAAVLPGTYSIAYQLCDKLTPANCALMTDVITVTANIATNGDSGTAISGTASTPIANVAANDNVNGSPATISGGSANATVSQSGTWPTGISLNVTTGSVTTTAIVAPGTYSLQYQLCDRNTPVNCRLQTLTITVSAAIAPVTENGTGVSGTASTPIANVRSNDSVNGAAALSGNSAIAQSGTWPTGIALNSTTGAITTSAAVQPGTYNVAYQLCDLNTPTNCATVTDQIVIGASIAPITDSGFATSGIAATPIANIASNDLVNGTGATLGAGGNATIAISGTWPAGITLNAATGAISTSAAVAPGVYALQYQLCDKNSPVNCQTQSISITVNGNIAPLPESGSAVSGTPATVISNVASNDNVNGVAATLGAGGNATIAQSGTWPTGIVLNTATGAITTSTSVQPGSYAVTYQLCDKATTPNCATVVDTITVNASILPGTDSGTATAGVASTPIANVAVNDNVNGAPATLGASGNATVATSGTWPAGIALNPLTGAITTTATVPPGAYVLQYQLCDKSTPVNCQTQTLTVTIAASIAPVTESGTAVSGTAATPIANVASNDIVNSAVATLGASGNATVAQSGTWPSGIALNGVTGAITTSASVQPGTYTVTYQLCDKNTPVNCQTMVDTITVTANIAPVSDAGVVTAGMASTAITNVAVNDNINGLPATLGAGGNATISQSGVWPTGIALNPATGGISTNAGLAPGVYTVSYQICDKSTPVNCQIQSATITVNGAIAPNPDSGTAISGTPATPVANIAANDFVNGPAATLGASGNSTVATSGTWPVGIALNTTTGAITTTAGVQPGVYVLAYTLCDKIATPNCANGNINVTVSANIAPVSETGTATSGTAATPVANVRFNDAVNGTAATNLNSTLAQSGIWPAGIALNISTGAITTTSAVQPGSYALAYQLCDLNTPTNCQTVTDTITIGANITPVTENGTAVSGTASTPITNVVANDNVNGVAALLGVGGNATIAQSGAWPTGIALNSATGAISVASSVRPGSYPVSYQLCDLNTPANCQIMSDTITASASILPMPDMGSGAAGSVQTPIANVAANDNVNGSPALLGGGSPNVTISQIGVWPTGVTLNSTTGAIRTSASVQPGNYVVQYQLCDTNTPVNCATSTASFTLTATMTPQSETGTGVSGVASNVIANVTSNDSVNGSAAALAGASYNATISQSGVWPSGISLNVLTGSISINASVQPGVYVVAYELCDRNTPVNCAISNNTVTVVAAIAPSADTGNAVSGTATTPINNIAANDVVNGNPATLGPSGNATIATVSAWPAGVTVNPLTGAVATAANVQPGTYVLQYQLCDKSTPANCQNQTLTLNIASAISPIADAGTTSSGTASTAIANIAANDSVNGFAAVLGVSGNAKVAQSGIWPTGIALNLLTGAITTTEDVQPGTYSVQYQLCDNNVPANCSLETAVVTVIGAIFPSNDSGTATSGTAGTPIANIGINDIVNGDPVTLGSGGNATLNQSGVWVNGVTLDPLTGAVNTTASVQPGTYVLQYQLCDKSAPPFCALANVTIVVSANIAPTLDSGSSISGTPSVAIANVAINDAVNGVAATLGSSGNATISQVSSTTAGLTLTPLTGAISVAAWVQPGSYVVTYRLCDKSTPANCATMTASVVVSANIAPVTENGTAVSGTPSTAIANIAANDNVNGVAATLGVSGNARVAINGTWPPGIALNPTTGAISTTAIVQPGTYTLAYELCDQNTPANCAIMTDTLVVSGNIVPTLDNGSAIAGTSAIGIVNIAANDFVNGTPATLGTLGNATLAINGTWPIGITLDPISGAIASDASVIPATYTLPYTLCDKSTPANCADQNAIITVFAAIRPAPDVVTISAAGGTAIPNVVANDTVNGMPANLGIGGNASISLSGTWPTGISMDTTLGAVTIVPGTPPGTYTLTYQLCDDNLPVNCATSIVTINVTPAIAPVTETGSAVAGTPSAAIANVTTNDSVNGLAAALGTGGNATIVQSGTWPAGITLDPLSGAVNTNASVQPGSYVVIYQLCDKNAPINCATMSDTLTVTANISPISDSAAMVAGSLTTPIANVAVNDAVNGAQATLGTNGNATLAQSGTWPNGVTLNAATGGISVGARVQPGTYVVSYQICDKSTPVNCQTTTATILVSASIVPISDNGAGQSGTASTLISDIAANDTVNGTPAVVAGSSSTARVSVVGTWPAGISLAPATGAVSITNSVPPGTYILPYQLCDKNVPANCENSTATAIVTAAIAPMPKSGTSVSGTQSVVFASVAASDMVNGSPAQIAGASPNATVAQSGAWPVGITLAPSSGEVSTTASVQPGVYVIQYQLCDTNTPTNCNVEALTITVTANIAPVADNGAAISGTPSTPIINIAANDNVNGAPATLGTSGNATLAPIGTWPTGIMLNPMTGSVSTEASVQPGTYTAQYQVCDKNTPANCQTQMITITVAGDIMPIADMGNAISGIAATPITNVATNDRVNGVAATLGNSGNATLTQVGVWPNGITLNPATGGISTSAALQPGTYNVQYQLCDKSTPANCQTQMVTLVVAGNIAPQADSGTAVSGTPSNSIANVAGNDRVNGLTATLGSSGNATVAQSGVWPTGIMLDAVTGAVSTSASVQPGTYNVQYQLCDKSTPANCQTQNVTVEVSGDIAPTADSGTAVSGTASTPVSNISANDMVNGIPATLGATGNATVATSATWPNGIALDPTTGAVTINASVQPGSYNVQYQLCDKSTPANCQTENVTVVVSGDIAPSADSGTAVSGTPSTPVANIAANDAVNGAPATLGATGNSIVATSGTWPMGITLNPATGAISTSATVQPGTYNVQYQLCDKSTPANCQTQVVVITVTGDIAPVADSGTATSGTPSTPIASLTANDRVNGTPASLGTDGNANVATVGTWPNGITLDPETGAVSASAVVQPGRYVVTYQLCDRSMPVNCMTQTATIVVSGDIMPVADSGAATSGLASSPVTNIAANDVVNGNPATLGTNGNAVVTSTGIWPAGITLNSATGAVSTSATVQPGTYTLQYQLCDTSTPANCQTQTVTITVGGSILPTSDTGTAVAGTASSPVTNIAANDVVNGNPATLGTNGNAVVTSTGIWPAGITLNSATGAVSTNAAVQPGTYTLQYQLCDTSTPANCQIQTVTIIVGGSILPTSDNGTAVSGIASSPIGNIAANDNVNGATATLGAAGNATIATTGSWPTGISLNAATGAVSTSAAVQPGTYTMQYQLCDKSTPANCQTQAITIVVSGAIMPVADSGVAISGTASVPVANVVANDIVNGMPATLGANGIATLATSSSWPTGITLNQTTGAVTTDATVQPGTYAVQYQLCDKSSPVNCQIQTITIVVGGSILPIADAGSTTGGAAGTPIANIAANDSVNGTPATLGAGGNASVTPVGLWPNGITLDPSTGAVSTTADVPPGSYSLQYQLCDKSSPPNCQTQTVTVVVVEHRGSITGTVYSDINADGRQQTSEPPRANWIVKLFSNGVLIGTTSTDADGHYRFDNVKQSGGYEIHFVNPENNVVYGEISNVAVSASTTVVDQNLPIDPAGVIFDSVTRAPVAGAIVTLVDSSGASLPASCFLDASQRIQRTGASGEYRFDLVPGGAPQCPTRETVYRVVVTPPAGYSANSTVLLPLAGPFDPTGLGSPVRISPLPTPALSGEVPYYMSFRFASGDPDIVFNHIPLDPFLTRTPLVVTKTSIKRTASAGDLVPYEITVRNTESVRRAGVTIADILPPGMRFVPGSARIEGVASTPVLNDRELVWTNQIIPANTSVHYQLVLIVGAGVTDGEKINTAFARNGADNTTVSNRGTAVISIVPSAVFDCSDLIGKVFEDRNRNGYQDEGEPGVPSVRLATVNGQLVTTDTFGRYHVTCAAVPDARLGSNFVLKVDTRTLPLNWEVTVDNPRSVRLTRGKIGELNFGVAPPRAAGGE
jgi:ligand-binding sensor protein